MMRHVIKLIALGVLLASSITHSQPRSNARLRVVMPKSVENDHQQLRQLEDAMRRAREEAKGTNRERAIAYVSATIGVGCTCPPWEWSAVPLGFMWPRYGRRVPEMPRIHGAFRLTGHLEGQKRVGFQVYNKPRPKKPMYDDGDPLDGKYPVFFVDEWCWEYSGAELFGHEVADIEELLHEGRVCAGANVQRLHREMQRATDEEAGVGRAPPVASGEAKASLRR